MKPYQKITPKTALKASVQTDAFVSVKDATSLVSYSSDYIARLARQGKIVAEQRGRAWFISPDSLKRFSLEQQAEQRARQAALKEERLQEYARKQVPDMTALLEVRTRQQVVPAFLLSSIATACVILTLAIGAFAFEAKLQPAQLLSGAADVLRILGVAFPEAGGEVSAEAEQSEVSTKQFAAQNVVITETGLYITDDTQVSEVISDPVVVTPVSSSTMVLTPVFAEEVAGQYVVELVTKEVIEHEQNHDN